MAPPRKALIAVTSAHAPLYPDGKETGMLHRLRPHSRYADLEQGLFVTEALHPFNVFREAGFAVELVSENGTYQADWLSQQKEWLSGDDQTFGIFFASAGHASLIDYPDAKGLQNIASDMFSDGKIISAVCHGGAIFPGIIDPSTGKSIIAGKRVTGFTTQGEEEEGVLDTIKSWHRPTIEAAAASAGAICTSIILCAYRIDANHEADISPPGPWDSFTQTDGLIVTGANPASAHATAVAAVEAFNKL
ncbi:MAG: hypothetical protein Q9191_008111 [Dirinaria sp. TL-2023a]